MEPAAQGVSEELLMDINKEATRRMTAVVAPQASDAHGPAMLRLSMGPLFEEVRFSVRRRAQLLYSVAELQDSAPEAEAQEHTR